MVAALLVLQAVSSTVASVVKILQDLVTIKRTSSMLRTILTLKHRATQVWLHTSITTVPNQNPNKRKRKNPRKARRIRKRRRANLHPTLIQTQVKKVNLTNLKVLKRRRLQKRNQRKRKRKLGYLMLQKQQGKSAAFKLLMALVLFKFRNQHPKRNHKVVISWIFSLLPQQLFSNLKETNQQADSPSCNNSSLINSHLHRDNQATCSVSLSTISSRISVNNLTWLNNKIQAATCLEV